MIKSHYDYISKLSKDTLLKWFDNEKPEIYNGVFSK